MRTFVQQAGAPFVAVQAQCKAGATHVALRQQRYFFDREMFNREESKELWQIPVCLKQGAARAGKTCRLLTEKEARFEMPGCGNWTLSNAGAEGFYRSGYDASNVRALAKEIEPGLTPAERIMLLGDVWAGVRVGRRPITDYLALAEGLQNETSRPVVTEMLSQIEYIGQHLTSDSDQPQYQSWVRQLLAPSIRRLGFEPKPGESEEDRQLRGRVLEVSGVTGNDPAVLAWARAWTSQALESNGALDNAIADTAMPLAARDGNSVLYDRLVEKQKRATTPEEFYVYLDALSSFRDPRLIERALNRALSPDVRSQDAVGVISEIMEQPAGSQLAWEFAKSHWTEIEKMIGGFAGAGLVEATSTFCSAEQRDQVQEFFSTHKVASATRGLQQSLERISNCADLKSQQGSRLAQWLNDHEVRVGQ
jgi:aminopeptidase N/puromycin-sensitive aminopeptidase